MHIDALRLENFRCFGTLDILLHPKMTILVAENGQGKSTTLDAVRIGLWPFVSSFDLARKTTKNTKVVNDSANAIAIDDARLVRMGAGDMARQLPTRITLTGDFGSGAVRQWGRFRDSEAKASKTKDEADTKAMKRWASAVQAKIRNPESPVLDLPVFGYYGTGRLWAQKRLTDSLEGKDDTEGSDFYVRTFAYLNCLDPASSYKHFKEWFIWGFTTYRELQIKQLETQSVQEDLVAATERIQVVQQAIDCFLKPTTGWHTLEYSISHEKSLILQHPEHGTMNVDLLSDGIRSMLAMVGDLAYRCIKLNPHLGIQAAQLSSGVVMIDEVDMHLHPSWQQTVIADLMTAFPKLQFIVTTHSPQVLSTVSRENIRVLHERETGHAATMPQFSPLAHEAGDALSKIMGTHSRPPLPLQDTVREFEQYVRAGEEGSQEAQELRQQLDKAGYQLHDADLALWRLLSGQSLPAPGVKDG